MRGGWRARALCALLALFALPAGTAATVLDLPWPQPVAAIDGLPTTGLRALAEDATGYLWMAGDDGLLRFDGRRVRVWHRADGQPDPALLALHVDARDDLWLGSVSQGLLRLRAGRRVMEPVGAGAPAALRSGRVAAITSTADGSVWAVGADHRLYVLSPATAAWQVQALPGGDVTALVRDDAGTLWMAGTTGLYRLAGRTAIPVDLPARADRHVHGLWADPRGGVRAHTATGSWHVSGRGAVQAAGAGIPLLRSVDGADWEQQATGLFLLRRARQQRVHLRPPHGSARQPVEMHQGLQDRQGDIWWLSVAHGLWRLPARWREFTALPPARDGLPGIDGQHALALAASADGRLWVAGSGGRVQRLDLRTGARSDTLAFAGASASAAAVGMVEDPAGRLWLATDGTLLRYHPARREVRRWPLALPGGSASISLAACADGTLWLAHPAQIQRWSAGGTRLLALPVAALGLSPGMPQRQLLCDRTGRLWATDRAGPHYWEPAQARFVAAGTGAVTAMAEADDGSLWLSRQDALEQHRWTATGLQRLQRVDGAHGYPQVRAHALAVDAQGRVWAGVARGLVRLDPAQARVCVLGHRDGLPVQEVLDRRLVRLRTGALAAAVREGGLLLVEPGSVQDRSPVPRLVINAVRVERDGRERAFHPSGTAPEVLLTSTDRDVQVAVNLLGPGDPEGIQYRFQLAGHDAGWVQTGPVALRGFARLPVGRHLLQVQARHADGPWSAPQRLHLQVAPAWWQTPAGYLLLAALAAAAVMVLARSLAAVARRRGARRAAAQQQALAEQASAERSRFLVRLGGRIRPTMTAVCGWSELLLRGPLDARQRSQARSLHRAGQHLVQVVDDALDLAAIAAGRVQVCEAPFAPVALLRELHDLLQPVAAARQLSLHWESSLDPAQRWVGDERRVRQILLNLLGNALKFTARGRVQVTACAGAGGRGLRLQVIDSGPGIRPAQLQRLFQRYEQAEGDATHAVHGGSGLGLAICRELARAMGGDITVDSCPGHGTRFEVVLPLCAVAREGRPARRHAAVPAGPFPALRVLVVLPQVDTGTVVAALLQAQGLVACSVPACADALAPGTVHAGDWQVIAADPDLRVGGERLGCWLHRQAPGSRRLALSTRADAYAERDASAAGFDGFLRLPASGQQLAQAVLDCRCRA